MRTKRLVFGCLLVASCNHSSPTSSAPATTTVAIPSTTATTTPSAIDGPPETKTPPPVAGDPCDTPSPWPVDEALSQKSAELVVLAWRQRNDDRPLYIDEALVWERSEGAGYYLAHAYRHPKDDDKFHLSVVCDAPIEPERNYAKPPTVADLRAFLKGTTWGDRDEEFKVTAGKVCRENFERVFHAPPPRDFK